MRDVVFYHKNCLDGLFSAATVYKYLKLKGREEIVLIPLSHKDGIDLDLLDESTNVWIVDFSFPYEVLKEIDSRVKFVTLYDHHISTESLILLKDTLPNTHIYVDISRSGARICWDKLFSSEAPRCILLSEDRDLWRFKFPETRAFTESLMSRELNPDDEETQKLLEKDNLDSYILEGETLFRSKTNRVKRAINKGFYGIIKGNRTFFVNASEDISEIGEAIYKSHTEPIVAAVYYIDGDVVKFSLRSNTVNVESIAREFNGGGHVGAAGFQLKLKWKELINYIR